MNLPDHDAVRVVFCEEQVARRLQSLAAEISDHYRNSTDPLLLLGILNGCVPFLGDLLRLLHPQVQDRTNYKLVRATSYRGIQQGALEMEPIPPLDGVDVLVVEDIVDTGITINEVLRRVGFRNPLSVRVATMLDKQSRRVLPVDLHHVGFPVDDVFVVGYGMDYEDQFRALRWIGAIN